MPITEVVGAGSYVHPDYFKRVMIFIDNSNILHSIQRFKKGLKIDYAKLIGLIKGNRELIRTYLFGSYLPEEKDKALKFYNALLSHGDIEIISKPVKTREREGRQYRIEKGVDVALVTYLLKHAFQNTFDIAVLVSGDEDYVDAVKVVKDLGKKVEIAAFKNSIAPELKKIADKFIPIDNIISQIILK